jgi:hypothetical protein
MSELRSLWGGKRKRRGRSVGTRGSLPCRRGCPGAGADFPCLARSGSARPWRIWSTRSAIGRRPGALHRRRRTLRRSERRAPRPARWHPRWRFRQVLCTQQRCSCVPAQISPSDFALSRKPSGKADQFLGSLRCGADRRDDRLVDSTRVRSLRLRAEWRSKPRYCGQP